MPLSVRVEETQTAGTRFPKLMVSDQDTLVLFERPHVGTVIRPGVGQAHKGHIHVTDFDMGHFSDFHGEVTLKNEVS